VRIRFETTMDDVIAFNRFHFENSPLMRRQRMFYALVISGMLAVVSAIGIAALWKDAPLRPHELEILVGCLVALASVGSIATFFFARSYWMRLVERNVRKMYSEGSNRTMLGWREMELAGARLKLKTEFLESSVDLRAIDKIVGDADYTFVYIASAQAYLIPMNLYPEDEYRQFVAELRQAWENREDMPPIPANQSRDDRIMQRPR
jgi:hypothetical protein